MRNRDVQREVRASQHLAALCEAIGPRPTGSAANRGAAEYVADAFDRLGLRVSSQVFTCVGWACHGTQLGVDGVVVPASASPYSPACRIRGALRPVTSLAELASADLRDAVALVHGPLAAEPLTPRRFPFYQVPEHQRIVALLEAARPLAVIAATGINPAAAGALSPFPLFEDGDLDMPSVYLHEAVGARLAQRPGAAVELSLDARRWPATGQNVLAEVGRPDGPQVVVTAHLDTKPDTPGALDNASGVVVMLLAAERLAATAPHIAVTFVALNGEDHYANPGEVAYLAAQGGDLAGVALAINVDGVGDRGGRVAFSTYGCSDATRRCVAAAFADGARFAAGDAWFAGDHALFVQRGRPAVALTSERVHDLLARVIHTPADTIDGLDPAALTVTADALADLLHALPTE